MKQKPKWQKEAEELGKWMRDVRLPQLEAEDAVQGSAVSLTLTSKERRELAELLQRTTKCVGYSGDPSDVGELYKWIGLLVPEGLD